MHHLGRRIGNLSSTAKRAVGILALVVALLAITVPSVFQAAVGTILGGVLDSSGASIAGAKVTITDAERGTTRALVTDPSVNTTLRASRRAPTPSAPKPKDSRASITAT